MRVWLFVFVALLGAGCAAQAAGEAETDRAYPVEGRWAADGVEIRLEEGRLFASSPEGEIRLGEGVVGRPALAPGLVVAALDEGRSTGRIAAWRRSADGRWERRLLVDAGGRPDRVALSPDGSTVAFVWGRTGIASVYTVPADGSAPPVQRTNVGIEAQPRRPGQPPPGFVPPPGRDGLRFQGDELIWQDAQGNEHRTRWR